MLEQGSQENALPHPARRRIVSALRAEALYKLPHLKLGVSFIAFLSFASFFRFHAMSCQRIDKLISSTLRFLNDVAGKWEAVLPHDNLPPSFGNTREWVSLVQEILGGIQDQRKANSLDPGDPAILDALESTKGAAKSLSAIFRVVADTPETERGNCYEEFLRKPNASGIEVVLLQLLQGPQELINECIIEATVDQDHQLTKAIEELTSSQPPIPVNQAPAVAHYGRGDQFSNLANGHQNINRGNGAQYIAERMSWAGQSDS